MPTSARLPSVLVVLHLLLPDHLPSAPPVSIACFPENHWQNINLRNYLVRLVTAPTNSELDTVRTRYQLSSGTAATVSIQKTKSLCTQAGQAFHNVVAPGTPQKSRTIVLIKVGNNRYIVHDPTERLGEFRVHIVFDLSFNRLVEFSE